MTIQEILEAHHKIDWDDWGYRRCRCGFQFVPKYSATAHRAHVAEVLDKHMREREAEAWDEAKRAVSGIPFWYAGRDHHGFDLWENEDGIAQESGARIEVMKILDNNPFTDSYVDPYAGRPKREDGRRKDTSNGR